MENRVCTADDLAKILMRVSDDCVWLQLLCTSVSGRYANALDCSQLAAQIMLFLQTKVLETPLLEQVLHQLRPGQIYAVAAWWVYLRHHQWAATSQPPFMSTMRLEKKKATRQWTQFLLPRHPTS